MGELQHEAFQFTFNGFLKVAFQGSRVTSDAGLILVRELDERLGLETLISEHLSDSRQGLNTQFSLADLLRQSVYSRLAGYEDLNDAVRVSVDPTFRLIGSPKMWDRGAALTSTLHWFETELLTQETNLVGLRAVNREVLAQAEMATRADRIVLDMDSSESPVHGAQEGSAYNGHFESVCYHPLFLFTEHGDCLAATLRPGTVHSADDWDDLLVPEIDRRARAWRSAQTDCLQGGAPPGRAVPSRRLRRDQHGPPEPLGRPVLQQARHGGAMDQRRQAGDALDAAVVPSVPGERSATATERPGLQPGQLVAQTGPAAADQALVAHESPAAAGEDRGPAGEARKVLLAPPGGRASEPAAVRRHAAEDLGATCPGRLTRDECNEAAWRRKGTSVERCLRTALKAGARVGSTSSAASAGSGTTCDEEIWRAERRVGVQRP